MLASPGCWLLFREGLRSLQDGFCLARFYYDIRSTETTQTEHTNVTHSLALWISYLPTVKYLTSILQPLTNESRHKVRSTRDFIDIIKTVQIPDDHKLVSFDVKSLFTSIPLQLALDCTETAITNSTHELPLPKDPLVDDGNNGVNLYLMCVQIILTSLGET